jgi:PIN domain nuclease of toxin-antitoxin system
MRCLLDTHIWLWSLLEPKKLAPFLLDVLKNPQNELFISPITVWEALILAEKGRLTLQLTPVEWVKEALQKSPVQEVPLTHSIALKSREMKTLLTVLLQQQPGNTT